jgi:ureidoglycolate lyase
MRIKANRLTAEAFAPYGQVLQGTGAAPERKPFAAQMINGLADAKPNLTFMKLTPATASIVRIDALERHVHSNQSFIPLNGTRHLVAVCPADVRGRPIVAELRAFVAEGSQAINYDADVWHAPRQPLSAPGEFVMFRWENGSALDTEWARLDVPVEIDVGL